MREAASYERADPLPASAEVLVLGIGNLLWADEGFGIRAIEVLEERYEPPEGVVVLDGGTQGLYLVPYVQAARRLLVFDAVDYGDPPGALRVVRDEAVPRFGGVRKMSLHQTGFQEVLQLAELLGTGPKRVTLIGAQAGVLEDFGGSLSEPMSASLEPALALGLAELETWGFPLQPRRRPLAAGSTQLGSALARVRYEAERPTEAQAFRGGDARFLGGLR